jgi:hypothetical protein
LGFASPFKVAPLDDTDVAEFEVVDGARPEVVNCSTAPNDVPTEF